MEGSSFRSLLRQHRRAAGLTQAALARRAGLSERTIQDLERGISLPRHETADRLIAALAVPPEARAQIEQATSPPRRADGRGGTWPGPIGSQGQVGAAAYRSAVGPLAGTLPSRLSPPVTGFVGRERELAELQQLLGTCRLLTLTGPGGCGKTRLALQLAGLVEPAWTGGVLFVSLAALADPRMVVSTIATRFGLQEPPGQPLAESLARFIADKHLLLVLDNFEHLVSAAPVLVDLLAACPRLAVLVTSREVLHLSGELVYPVPSLSLPVVDTTRPDQDIVSMVSQSEAVRLFVDRARNARPSFQLDATTARAVAEICQHLDGLPLALELAAARARHLTTESLRVRLEHRLQLLTGGPLDLPTRQRTLRDAISWSYDLLSESERHLFRRLGVFAGGLSLEAAEQVALVEPHASIEHVHPASGAGGASALDLVSSLVEKSLITPVESITGETRYLMLETIREYALDALATAGEEPLLRRWHRDWFLALAERAAPELLGPEQVRWLDRLAADHDNLRAALRWCLDVPDAESGLRFGAALWRFWEGRNHLAEGRAWLDQLLSLDCASAPPIQVCRAQFAAGRMAFLQGDSQAALRFVEPSLACARDLGDQLTVALTLIQLGHLARDRGDLVEARVRYDEGLVLWRQLDDRRGIAISLLALGRLALIEGDVAQGLSLLEDSLSRYRSIGELTDVTRVLLLLGGAACDLGRLDEARDRYVEGLQIAAGLRDRGRMAANLEGCAVLAAAQAQPERAVLLAGIAASISKTTGTVLALDEQRRLEAMLAPMRRALGAAGCAELAERAREMTLDQAIAYALVDHDAGPGLPGRAAGAGHRPTELTRREQQVAALIGRGLTNQQIAVELVLSRRTVEWHVGNLLGKLSVRTRAQLAAWGARHALATHVDPGSVGSVPA